MEKEKILEMSREENKKEDERSVLCDTKSYANAFFMVNGFCVAYYLYARLFLGKNNMTHIQIFGVLLIGSMIYYASKLYYLRKAKYLVPLLLFAMGSILYLYVLLFRM